MKVLTCYSLKGGVGKTTSAVSVAHIAANSGYRTLLIDLDPQGSASWLLRTERGTKRSISKLVSGRSSVEKVLRTNVYGSDYDNLDVVPYGVETVDLEAEVSALKKPEKGVSRIFGIALADYDLVVVDLPPAAGPLSRAILSESTMVIFVMTPALLSLHALEEAKDRIPMLSRSKTRVLFTMVEPRRNSDISNIEYVRSSGNQIFNTYIQRSTLFDRMQEKRAPIAAASPRSKAAENYRLLFAEVEKEIGL